MRRNDRGVALVVAMVVIIAIAGMATALMNMASLRSKGTNDRLDDFLSFQAAQAAMELAKARINVVLTNYSTTFPVKHQGVNSADYGVNFLPDTRIPDLGESGVGDSQDTETTYTLKMQRADAEYSMVEAQYFAIVDYLGAKVVGGTDNFHFYRIIAAARLVDPGTDVVHKGGERVLEMVVRILEPPPDEEEGDPYVGEAGFTCGGNLRLSGNPDIVGAEGNVHVNGNVEISGNATVAGHLRAHGDMSISGSPSIGEKQPDADKVPVPQIDPTKLLDNRREDIDYIFGNDGKVRDNEGNVVFDSVANGEFSSGWKFSGDPSKPAGENSWDLSGNSTEDGTLYFETNIKVSGNPSHGQGNSKYGITATYITEHSAKFSGVPWVAKADTGDYFIVAGGDVMASGNGTWGGGGEQGWVLAHEQVYISGNPDFHGAIISEDAADDETEEWVKRSGDTFGGGNPYIEYNGGLAMSDFDVEPPEPVTGEIDFDAVVWRER